MTGPTNTPARPTFYAGCQFRSALEARWAVFFQAQGITWNYEPATFKLTAGWYIPDFHLTWSSGRELWAEVKPGLWDLSELDKARFSEFKEPLVILDGVPEPRAYQVWSGGWVQLHRYDWGPMDPLQYVFLDAACRKAASTRFRRKP